MGEEWKREMKKEGETHFQRGSVRGRDEGDPEGDKVESVAVWCVQIDAVILLHQNVFFFSTQRACIF